MNYRQFRCEHCSETFTQFVGETVLSAACPGCGRVVGLLRLGMNLGLSLSEAVFTLLAGYTLYRLLRD